MKNKNKHLHHKKKPIVSVKTKSNPDSFLFINKFIEKNGIYILLSLISLIVFFVFKDFILLKKLYLFKDIGSDSINYNFPQYVHIADYLKTEGIPKWSFNQGMGQNLFPGCIPDPFTLFILIMGKDNVAYTVFFAEFFKIFFAGLFFYLFIKKLINSEFTAIIGGVMYSFTGFIILGGCWSIFSTEAVYLALLLYSFEKLYKDNNWFLFPISIFLITINQPVDLYLFGLFLLIYLIFRFIEEKENKFKKVFFFFTKLAGLGILGVSMSSFFLINDIIQMLESPRVSGSSSYFNKLMSFPIFGFEEKSHYVTAILRSFSSDIMGTGMNFKGWYNYLEAPLFYCGLVNLLLFPQIFLNLDRKRKILYSALFAFFIIPVIFPFFRYSYWLFAGDYYRSFSLFVTFILLLYSIKALDFILKTLKINIVILIISVILLLILLYYPYYENEKIINEKLRSNIAIFICIYAFLIYLLKFNTVRVIIQIAFFIVLIIELSYLSNITINKRPVITGIENKQKIGYNDYTVEAVEFLKSKDKSFFRINKDYFSGLAIHSSINDAKAQDFYGTQSYHSFNQLNYVKFLIEMGIIDSKQKLQTRLGAEEVQTRWASGVRDFPLLHSFASVKYALTKTPKSNLIQMEYDSLTTIGDIKILKNKFALPLGFTYNTFIRYKNFTKLSQIQKATTLFKACVINDSIYSFKELAEFNISDTSKNYSWDVYAKDIANLKIDTLKISEHTQNSIKGKINLDKKKMLFFSIPYDKGWVIKVNGKDVKPFMINIGFIGLFLDKGENNVELSYLPPFYYTSAIISLISVFLFIVISTIKLLIKKKRI
ncbi:MAG: YfhO family protein [Bacteroidales bacterium]|jgi:uncharacterized membrane protein YfhO